MKQIQKQNLKKHHHLLTCLPAMTIVFHRCHFSEYPSTLGDCVKYCLSPFLTVPVCLSVSVAICLSASLSVCLPLSVCLSVCVWKSLSFSLSPSLSFSLSSLLVYLCTLSFSPSLVYIYIYIYIYI